MLAFSPRVASLFVLTLPLFGCAGSQNTTPNVAPQDSYPEDPDPAVDPKASGVRDEAPAQNPNEAPSESAKVTTTVVNSSTDYQPMSLTYRVSPDGLRVQLEEVEFVPEVEAIKVRGKWGVKLTVTAVAEGPRVLWSPDGGPMAFGGVVHGANGASFADKRVGDGELSLVPGETATFSRTWPGKDEEGLSPNQILELHVGLWGLGMDAESRTPVRRFIVVKMRAYKDRAHPRIEPPRM